MSDTMLTTNRIGMAADGTVYQTTPAGMVKLAAFGPGVVYGAPQTLAGGDNLPTGIWEVLDGRLEAAIGGATVRQITLGG